MLLRNYINVIIMIKCLIVWQKKLNFEKHVVETYKLMHPYFERNNCSRTTKIVFWFGLDCITLIKWMTNFDGCYENINSSDFGGSLISALNEISEKKTLCRSKTKKIFLIPPKKSYNENERTKNFVNSISTYQWNKSRTKSKSCQ